MAITEKWIYGIVYDADGEPDKNKTVSASLNTVILRDADGSTIETDKAVEAVTDGTGRFAMALHPNNEPGDSPINTRWNLTLPDSGPYELFIPYDHPSGATEGSAIKFTSLITLPGDGPDPISGVDLAAIQLRLDALETAVTNLDELDDDSLIANGYTGDLVAAATASASLVTTSTNGIMSSVDKTKLDSITVSALVTQDEKGIIPPIVEDPTDTGTGARIYQSSSDAQVKAQRGTVTGRTSIAPPLGAPSWKAGSSITITSTNWGHTLATLNVVANSTYRLFGHIGYVAGTDPDLMIRFASLPTGATLTWGYTGITQDNTGTLGRGSLDATQYAGATAGTFGGQGIYPLFALINGVLTVGATAGSFIVQAQKTGTGSNPVITANSAIFLEQWA